MKKLLAKNDPARVARCVNRAIELPADSSQAWVHIAPFGTFETTRIHASGKQERGPLAYDMDGFKMIVAKVKALNAASDFRGLMIGEDHLAHHETGTTRSYGQVKDAKIVGDGTDKENDGLYYLTDFNPTGGVKVRNREFGWLSGEFDAGLFDDGVWRVYGPDEKWAAALTNDPNLPVKALNRAPAPTTSATASPAGGKAKTTAQAASKGNSEMDKYRLMTIDCLKLNATATDEEIDAAFAKKFGPDEEEKIEGTEGADDEAKKTAKAMNRVIRLQAARIKELETADLEKQADAFCEEHKAHINNRAEVRSQFIANPDATKKLFGSVKLVEPVKALNAAAAQTPAQRDTQPPEAKESRKVAQDAEVERVLATFKCRNRTEARSMATTMNPGLFAEK